MIPGRLLRVAGDLRVRLMVPIAASVLIAGAGFELVLVTLTRNWLLQEMEYRTRALAEQLADRTATPLVLADTLTLNREIARRNPASDVIGVAVFDTRGRPLTSSADRQGLWAAAGPVLGAGERSTAVESHRGRAGGENLMVVTAPVYRQVTVAVFPEELGGALVGGGAAAPGHGTVRQHVGWVRAVVSLDRAEGEVATAARAGLLILLAAMLLGLLAAALLVRVVVRPLREAGALAREIAAGQLDRRLPVRGHDELGALAESLNTMAGSLEEARRNLETEAQTLRGVTEAMMSIARGVRSARDPARVFDVVSREVHRLTRCDGVALAVPQHGERGLVFARLNPELPWGSLTGPPVLEPEQIEPPGVPRSAPRRLDLESGPDRLSRTLGGAGYRRAVLVPLVLDGGPLAMLLLVSREPAAFAASELDVVLGLTSHLSAALHAARLNDRLEDAFEELSRTHDYLVQSEMMRVAGEMAAGAAHEFNNVLGAILGRAQLLSLKSAGGDLDQEELLTSLSVIERAALDGRETGRRLRQFGRAGDSPSQEQVDIARAIRDAVEFTRPRWENEALAAGRRIDVCVEAEFGLWVRGRAHEMREVFTNLILNAVDALPEGGTVRLLGERRGGQVVAAVEDDGVGMSEDTRRRLFEPFYSTKGPSGTGLGLSLVYGILKRCEGTVEAAPGVGSGTRIEVRLPATAAGSSVIPVPEAPDFTPAQRALDVLVVDDEDAVRDVLRDMVETLGHRVVTCDSGEEAIAAHVPGRFQLVLTDLGMPGVTGWKLAHAIRATDPDVTIVFVTGWGEDVSVEARTQAGVDMVVPKPFSMEDVLEATRIAMARTGSRRAA